MSKAKSGGGITSRVNRKVEMRVAPKTTNVINPAATDYLGQSTAFGKGPFVERKAPDFAPMGNSLTNNCGPNGEGRTIYKSGFQSLHGKAAPGEGKMQGAADRGPRAILGADPARPQPKPFRRGQQQGE